MDKLHRKIMELEMELSLLRENMVYLLSSIGSINDTLADIRRWQKWNDNSEILQELRDMMIESFNESECKNLCFDIGVSYESLPGTTIDDKCRELVLHQKRRNRVDVLVTRCRELRPGVRWPDVI